MMKIAGFGALALVILVVGVFAFGPLVAERIAFSKMDPENRAHYNDWKNKKLELPADALDIKPYPDDLKAAAKQFLTLWDKQKTTINDIVFKNKNLPADAAGLAQVSRALADLAPVKDVFSKLVDHPEYEIAAIVDDDFKANNGGRDPGYGPPSPNYLSLQNMAKILQLDVQLLSSQGKSAEAMQQAERIIRAGLGNPNDNLICQLISVAVCAIGTQAWHTAVASCPDPAILHHALERQKAMESKLVFMTSPLPISGQDVLGSIREVKRRGVKVDLSNTTERELSGKWMEVQADYMEKVVLPEVKSDPALVNRVQYQINSYRSGAATFGGRAYGLKGYSAKLASNLTSPFMYGLAIPNFKEAQTRAKVARAKYDLLQVETARRLYQLEHGAAPASDTALVPAYLATLPADRFATDKANYRTTTVTYSVGPDGKDDAMAIVYDPSNGTLSAGDLAFVP